MSAMQRHAETRALVHAHTDRSTDTPATVSVESLPDLIDATEYPDHPDGRLVRVRIKATETGVVILGDAFRPTVLEALLTSLGDGPIEEMLCG